MEMVSGEIQHESEKSRLGEKTEKRPVNTVANLLNFSEEDFFFNSELEEEFEFVEGQPKIISVPELLPFFKDIKTTQGLNMAIKTIGIEPIKIGRTNYLTSENVRQLFSHHNIFDYSNYCQSIGLIATKGGVGKTTVTINLATRLVQLGFKVCVVDVDSQANATQGLGVQGDSYNVLFDVVTKECDLEESIIRVSPNLHLIPSGSANALLEAYISLNIPRVDKLFQNITTSLKDRYDFVIYDCSPSLGAINSGVLFGADRVLIPMSAGAYSYKSVGRTMKWIRDISEQYDAGKDCQISVFINMYEENKKISKAYFSRSLQEPLLEHYNMDTIIPLGEAVKQQSEEFLSVFETNKSSRIKKALDNFVLEFLGVENG